MRSEENAIYSIDDEVIGSLKVSVLIPVYNDIQRIETCLESLENQLLHRDEYEIIVIDNGSSDGTYELLSQKMIDIGISAFTVTQCLTPGSYAARNHGLKMARGRYIAFTDSDCIVSSHWLQALLDVVEGLQDDIIVAGKVSFFPDSGKQTEQSAIDFENMFSMKQDENAKNGKCITANLFCARTLLKKHNGFNQKLKSGGDFEFTKRVVKNGGRVLYSEAAFAMHPSRNTKELLAKRQRIIGGTWDSQLSERRVNAKLYFLWRLLNMFIGRSNKVLLSGSLSASRKCRLIYLLFLIMTTSVTELIKLMSGKEANRT